MAHSIDVISRYFIKTDELLSKMKEVALKQKCDVSTSTANAIDVWIPETISLEIRLLTEDKFNDLQKDGYWGAGYSILFFITIHGKDSEEDEVTFPFLKELLNYYPALRIFNEEVPGDKALVYSKADLDGVTDGLFASMFTVPPTSSAHTSQ